MLSYVSSMSLIEQRYINIVLHEYFYLKIKDEILNVYCDIVIRINGEKCNMIRKKNKNVIHDSKN